MYTNVIGRRSITQDGEGNGGIAIPLPLFYIGLGATLGFLLGPTIWAATDAGRKELAKIVREKIER
jgi:hypothetical protein